VAWHILLESSQWGLQLCLKLHLNRRSTHKVMGLQSYKNPNFENFETPIENPGTKWHLDANLVAKTEYTIRGKVVTSPKSGLWWVLWVCVCSWFVRAPKVLQLHTNQLLVWFVQVHVSNWIYLSIFLVPISELQHALLTQKCCEPGSMPKFLSLPLFSL
jgi:hypothetical protein